MGVLFLLTSYVVFHHVGRLLMRLVVVQPVGDSSVMRWCFASTFAFSLSLFSAVLADMAHASLSSSISLSGAAATQSSFAAWLHRLQRLFEVDTREFTFLLASLLATVLVACPSAITFSFFRQLFRRGKSNRHIKTGRAAGSKRAKRPQRSSPMSSGSLHGIGSRRSSLGGRASSSSSTGFSFDEDDHRSPFGCCGRRILLFAVVLLLLIGGAYWISRTGPLNVRRSGQFVMGVGKAVYKHLQTRTILFKIPKEIQSNRQAGKAAAATAADGGDGTTPVMFTPEPKPKALDEVKKLWPFDLSSASAALAPLDLIDLVRAVTSRVAVVGVAMIGLLGGYAAVTSPYLFLAPYTYYRGREGELRKAQGNFTKKLCYVLNNYGNAQRQIAALQYGVLHEEWTSLAFSSSAPSSNTHSVPPFFAFPPSSSGNNKKSSDLFERYNDDVNHVDSSSPPYEQQQQEQKSTQNQFVESSSPSVKQYPPPPRWPASSEPLDLSAFSTSHPTSSAASAASSATGAVGWLQRKLTNAATVVTGSITSRLLDSPATPSSSAMSPAVLRQRAAARIKRLREESKGAHFLCLSLYLQLNEVEGMLRDAQRGGTWVGRWYAGLGVAMALYSAVKVLLTGASLWYFKASTQDPVTRAVSLLEDAFILRRRSSVSVPSFSVTAVEVSTHVILAIALIVNGWMVLSSIRGALLALFHVTMSFSGSTISRPETVAVALSMMIGVYFTGQLVLLRTSLPGSSQWQSNTGDGSVLGANVLLQVLGTLPYYYYQRLNDWCFLVGCLCGVIVRRFVLRNALSSVVYTASGGEER